MKNKSENNKVFEICTELTKSQFEDIISDLTFSMDNAKIHLVIDPMEIVDFCFPLSIRKDLSNQSKPNERIIQEQIALSEVLYFSKTTPILLDEYIPEIIGLASFLEQLYNTAESKALELHNYFNNTNGLSEVLNNENKSQEKQLDKIYKNFPYILASLLGFHYTGIKRFNLIREKLRVFPTSVEKGDEKVIQNAFDSNRGGEIYNKIYNEFLNSEVLFKQKRNHSMIAISKAKRNARVDAHAIDRIISINNFLEEKYLKNKLSIRHIYLYLSSAKRSKRIFSKKVVIDHLPIINGKKLNILRNRGQIYTELVCLEKSDKIIDFEKSITNVKKLSKSIKKYNELIKKVDKSNLDEMIEEPEFVDIKKYLDPDSNSHLKYFESFGVFLNTINNYEELVSSRKKILESKVNDSRDDEIEKKLKVLTLLKDLFSNELFLESAKHQREVSLYLKDSKTKTKLGLLESLASVDPKSTNALAIQEGRDVVIGSSHYLPTMFFHIKDEIYINLIKILSEFYNSIHLNNKDRMITLKKAVTSFIDVDKKIEREINFEHELVRSLFLLASQITSADIISYEHSIELLSLFHKVRSKSKVDDPDIESDIRVVICWTGRRCKSFHQTKLFIDESISQFPDDARFYHAKSLNIYAWIHDEDHKTDLPGSITMIAAIKNSKIALDLLIKNPQNNERLDIKCALMNTISYFYCLGDKSEESYDLALSREYMGRLKKIFPSDKWKPKHPEYFHSEALLEYKESKNEKLKFEKLNKLRTAYNLINAAIDIVPSRENYKQLKKEIKRSIKTIK